MQISFKRILLISVFLTTVVMTSCSHSNNDVDVSGISVELKFDRFDKDLMEMDTNSFRGIDLMQKKYKNFFRFCTDTIMAITNPSAADSSDAFRKSISLYINNSYVREIYDSIRKHFPSTKELEDQLTDVFKHFKYYFPDFKTPHVITIISDFGLSAFTVGAQNEILGIALQMYLGAGSKVYRQLQNPFPDFMIRKFSKEYIVSSSVAALAQGMFDRFRGGNKLLDQMIWNGKLLFLAKKILPASADSITTGFSKKSLDWLAQNETPVWKYFLKNNLLYNGDQLQIKKYVTDGPTTSGMPAESPGNVGSWVGLRIVEKYMQENPGISLSELMTERSAQKILTLSKYKPQ